MHRSGTSLTAQWLHKCGLNLGDRLLAEDFSNKKGHFEDLDFLELHKAILKENNLKETGLEGNLEEIEITPYFKSKLKHICLLKNELHEQWAWKEPRTCLFIHEYLKILPNAKILVVFRDLAEVRTSLIKRDINRILLRRKSMSLSQRGKWTFLRKYYLKRWTSLLNQGYVEKNIYYHTQILNLLKNTDSCNYAVIKTNELKNKDSTIHNILEKWGFNLNKIAFNKIFDSKLYNHRNKDLKKINNMTDKEKQVYTAIEKFAI